MGLESKLKEKPSLFRKVIAGSRPYLLSLPLAIFSLYSCGDGNPAGRVSDAGQQEDVIRQVDAEGIDAEAQGDAREQLHCIDEDHDGYGTNCPRGNDCNDNAPLVHQTIECNYDGNSCSREHLYRLCLEECLTPPDELCDGQDNNCDGEVDEGLLSTFYLDNDGDGFGNADETIEACALPFGYVEDDTDCDDNNELVNPLAQELCDRLDNNCDREIDEEACGKITFVTNRDGYLQIYLMNPDGSAQTNLTNNQLTNVFPYWSPDGRQIAFTSALEAGQLNHGPCAVNVVDADGSNMRRLTDNLAGDKFASWSPDSRQIVFLSDRGGNDEIYVMNSDGTGQRNVSNYRSFHQDPAWSPDGNKIAFTSVRDAIDLGIYVMDSNGGNVRRLTNNPGFLARGPVWSPDGRKIAYYSNIINGNPDIYVMDADGSNQINLTEDPERRNWSPVWSPDSSKIAFTSLRGSKEIYSMNADGSDIRNLTNHPAEDWDPSWSPDGRKIAFETDRDGWGREVYVMDADGSNQINISNNPTGDAAPDWSP